MIQTTQSISVIICAYTEERWDDLIAAVESVQQQTLPPDEVIVVIDHNPSLLKRAREHFSRVIIMENVETPGAAGSRNSGLSVAKGRIIACLDDDARATPDWLMLLCQGLADPQVLGIGGAITPLWKENKPRWFPEEFYWVIGCTYRGMPQTVAAIRNLISANMAMRREVFDIVGGFRSDIGRIGKLPIGCEETELCIRAHQHWPQRVLLYLPDAKVFHNVPTNRIRWYYFCSRCFAEGLSKATLTQYVGVKDTLASERVYTLRTLPLGVMRGLSDAFLHHDLFGLVRAGVIAIGLAITTAGYLIGSLFQKKVKLQISITRNVFPRNSTVEINTVTEKEVIR